MVEIITGISKQYPYYLSILDINLPRDDVGEVEHDKAAGQIEIIPSFIVIPSKLMPTTDAS
jgi:hypothetical protein